jgi:hypothetical protein
MAKIDWQDPSLRQEFDDLMKTRHDEVLDRYRQLRMNYSSREEPLLEQLNGDNLFEFAVTEGLIGRAAANPSASSAEAPPPAKTTERSSEPKSRDQEDTLAKIRERWDVEFTKFRKTEKYPYSPVVDDVLRQYWEQTRDELKALRTPGHRVIWPKINPRIFFLTSLLIAAEKGPSSEMHWFYTAAGINEERLKDILREEMARIAQATSDENFEIVATPGFMALADRANQIRLSFGRDPQIALRHMQLALLEPPENGATGDLVIATTDNIDVAEIVRQFGSSTESNKWATEHGEQTHWPVEIARVARSVIGKLKASGPQTTEQTRIGGEIYLNQTAADEEACLNVNEYAEVLGKFFSKAGKGEFCFALFGNWGRGKTFLMKKLANVLKPKDYETVFFSAWKYPNAPEVWVHLYETLAEVAIRGNPFQTIPRLIRTGIVRHGAWSLLGVLASFAISLIPKVHTAIEALHLLVEVYFLVGLGGLIWLVLFVRGIHQTTKRLSKDYLTATRHTEKLGLQATIGTDLRSLLMGWMPQGDFKFGLPTFVYLALVGIVLWSALYWFGFAAPKEVPEALRWWMAAGVAVIGSGLLVWTFSEASAPKRILLVVDDLDRCSPAQLLSVTESIKLLVEDPEISKRVQLAMLVEEDILKNAILEKYSLLRTSEKNVQQGLKFSDKRLIYENCEKLFNAHLRLPPLAQQELTEILDKIVGRERTAEENRKKQKNEATLAKIDNEILENTKQESIDGPGLYEGSVVQVPLTDDDKKALEEKRKPIAEDIARAKKNEPQVKPDASAVMPVTTNFIFEKNEEDVLKAAIPRLIEYSKDRTLGPRSIRAFVFRYQLARMLLIKLKIPWSPQHLVSELVVADQTEGNRGTDDSKLRKVVRQVS